MTYREFYEAALALLPESSAVSVQVETWNQRDPRHVTTRWAIWCATRQEHYAGSTPEEALAALRDRRDTHALGAMPHAADTCEIF